MNLKTYMKIGFISIITSSVLLVGAESVNVKEDLQSEQLISYGQETTLEKKMGNRIGVISGNIQKKIKEENRELRRIKVEELDNTKNLKTKLMSDYEAYMAELKREANELKNNRYMKTEYKELQITMINLTQLHKKNQGELKAKIEGLMSGSVKSKRVNYLENLVERQISVMEGLKKNFESTKINHVNHKSMLKDTFYVDLENLKRKYKNDNIKLQELFKINTSELIKEVDEKRDDLKLDYWEAN